MRNGGLRLRRVSSLASSAFLASVAGTRQLQDRILHRAHRVSEDTYDICLAALMSTGIDLPDDSDTHRQNMLDKSVVESEYNQLLYAGTPTRITEQDCLPLQHQATHTPN